MEYDLQGMESEIVSIEKSAARLKELGKGVQAVEKNVDIILAFTYVLRRNVSDIIE
jgi:hypothetical protein